MEADDNHFDQKAKPPGFNRFLASAFEWYLSCLLAVVSFQILAFWMDE